MDKEERIRCMKVRKQLGLTLVEIMLVAIFLGIMITLIILPRVKHYTIQKRENKLKISVGALTAAINNYYSDYGGYPQTLQTLTRVLTAELGGIPPATLRSDLYTKKGTYSSEKEKNIHIVDLSVDEFNTYTLKKWGTATGGWIYNRRDGRIRVYCAENSSIGIPYWKYGHEYE